MKNDLNSTTELLLTLLDYCDNNNFSLYGVEKSLHTKFNICTKDILKQIKKTYPDLVIKVLNRENILENDFELGFEQKKANCSINPPIGFYKKIYEILVHVLWFTNKETLSMFSNIFFGKDHVVDLNYCIDYQCVRYPHGFREQKIRSYSENKNWRHFIENFSEKSLTRFWNSIENIKIFEDKLKIIKLSSDYSTSEIHSYLKPLIEKINIKDLTQDVMNYSSHMIVQLLSPDNNNNITKYYANYFPLIGKIMYENYRKTLLVQKESPLIKKVIFLKNEIDAYFYPTYSQHLTIIINIMLPIFSKNKYLKENGLISLDFIINDDVTCFLSLETPSHINQNNFTQLFISCLKLLTDNLPVKDDKNGRMDRELINEFINKAIFQWFLESKLIDNEIKIKKVKI